MKSILRIVSFILVCIIALGCFVACDDEKLSQEDTEESQEELNSGSEGEESEEPEDESGSSTKKKPTAQNKNRILRQDLSKYKFVVSADASEELKFATSRVCSAAAKSWGSESEIKTDDYATGAQEEYEILVGETNRTESSKKKSKLKSGEGGYAIDGSKITILGYTENETLAALDMFYFDRVMFAATNSIFFTDNDNFSADLSKYVSVMSFNIYMGIDSDAEKKANAISLIRAYSPDVFGVQEATAKWQVALKDEFAKDYHVVGIGRDANGSGEAMLVFVKKSKFNIKSSGTKWLSSTPDKVSKVEMSACNRIVTYAVIERISDGKLFNYANTHIDHVGGQDEQIKYLGQIIDANMQSGAPTFVTGDFNLTPDQEAFATMVAQGYTPSYELAKKGDSKKVGTFGSSAVIDYLFVRNGTNVDTYLYKVCNETDYGKHSDHYPVFNILKF